MSILVADVLEAWREAERLLDGLPALSPDHETVRVTVERLRDLYADLTATSNATAATIARGETTLSGARQALERARGRLAASGR
jgi:hypothetical protein